MFQRSFKLVIITTPVISVWWDLNSFTDPACCSMAELRGPVQLEVVPNWWLNINMTNLSWWNEQRCVLNHTSNRCLYLYIFFSFPPKNEKSLMLKKVCHFFFGGKRSISSWMSAVQSAEHRLLYITVKASWAPSTCRINQSFCDGAAGVCLAGN